MKSMDRTIQKSPEILEKQDIETKEQVREENYDINLISEWNKSKTLEPIFKGPWLWLLKYALNSIYKENIWEKFIDLNILEKGVFNLVVINVLFESIHDNLWEDFFSSNLWLELKDLFFTINNEKDLDKLDNTLKSFLRNKLELYLNRLNNLFVLAETESLLESDWFKSLLNNPIALSEILKTWKFASEWYEIDLNNNPWNIVIWTFNDIAKDKKLFIDNTTNIINNFWESIDSKMPESIFKALDFLGLDTKDKVEEIINTLKEFSPILGSIIGAFLKSLLWLTNKSSIELKDIKNKDIKKWIENLKKLQDKENKDLPYIPSNINDKDVLNLDIFLTKILKVELEENWWKATSNSIISNKDFWKNIYSNTPITEDDSSLIERIRREVQKVIPKWEKIKQEDFFKLLTKIDINTEFDLLDKKEYDISIIDTSSFQVNWDKYNLSIINFKGEEVLEKLSLKGEEVEIYFKENAEIPLNPLPLSLSTLKEHISKLPSDKEAPPFEILKDLFIKIKKI